MTYHIQIAVERRVPVVTERRVYLGKYEYKVDADGCTYMVELEPDNFEMVLNEDRSRLAIPIGTSVATGSMVDGMPEYIAGPTQLHTSTDANLNRLINEESLPPDFSDPQFVMVAEWDLKSPYVIQHKGDYHARTMTYAGWPEVTVEEWVEHQNANGEFL